MASVGTAEGAPPVAILWARVPAGHLAQFPSPDAQSPGTAVAYGRLRSDLRLQPRFPQAVWA